MTSAGRVPSWVDGGGAPVLVVHAHPDDEVFATGAVTAWLTGTGARVVLVVATAGEAAELAADPGLDEAGARGRRAARLDRSCAALGVAQWDWLGGAGRWVDDGGAGGPRALASADVEEVSAAIGAVLVRTGARLVLTVGGDGLTGHPDHLLVHRAVVDAARRARPRPRVLGARVRAGEVTAAHRLLAPLLGGDRAGSGRVVGCADDQVLSTAVGPLPVGVARRRALDAYTPGLGSAPLPDLLGTHPGRGDFLLLRALLDVTGWHTEHYEPLP